MQSEVVASDRIGSLKNEERPQLSPAIASNDTQHEEFEAPSLRKLRVAIDGYRSRVNAWEHSIRSQAHKQNLPTLTTLGLFGLGAGLCGTINYFNLRGDLPVQELALSNLGCVTLFVIASISLFYDRIMRGFGRELLLRRSGEHASEIAIQLHALAAIHVDLQFHVGRMSKDLDELSQSIETQNDIAEDLKVANLQSASQQEEYQERLADLRRNIMAEASRLNRFQHSITVLESQRNELELSIQAHTDHLFDIASQRENVAAELTSLEKTRTSLRASWTAEQEQAKIDAARTRDQLRLLSNERDALTDTVETIKADLIHLRDLRSDLQAEVELIGDEHDRTRSEFDQIQTALFHAQTERDRIDARIAESHLTQRALEETIFEMLGQLGENQEKLNAIESAIQRNEEHLSERRSQAERDAIEFESRQSERNRILQELERGIGNAIQEREALDTEMERLRHVKQAMEISIDELTHRLELRTTDLRKKNHQLQEQADRLEKLSEAIQKLTLREAEMRPSAETPSSSRVDSLPAPPGMVRTIHKPHLSTLFKTIPQSSDGSGELIEG